LSTAGALAPETYLFAPRGRSPTQCFKAVRRASPHANLLAVASGQLDVATDNSTALDSDRRKGRWEAGQVRVIWRSPILPEYPVVWRRDLDPAVKEKLRQFLLTYGQGDQPEAGAARARLARLELGVFEPADDSHLLPAKEMEATRAWLQARASGDKRKEDIARRALNAVTAQRQALEARTGAPAAAQ
jgi:phosphonate transport system substrate-binding protein